MNKPRAHSSKKGQKIDIDTELVNINEYLSTLSIGPISTVDSNSDDSNNYCLSQTEHLIMLIRFCLKFS